MLQSPKLLLVLLCALLLLGLNLFLPGCGKKEWPSPVMEEERFSWSQIEAARDNSCLVIHGELQGAVRNLRQVVLQLEMQEVLCPGCPFQVDQRQVYPPGDPALSRQDSRITITHCPVSPDHAVRIRLVGMNIYPQIQETLSEIVGLEAEQRPGRKNGQ